MLGLNKPKTEYTVTAYWYEYTGNAGNVQNFSPVGKKFKCRYASNHEIQKVNTMQGLSTTQVVIQTNSKLPFKENDKVVLNGLEVLIKTISIVNDPLTARYTNNPMLYDKQLTLA